MFTREQYETMVLETIDHASAPPGSAKYLRTPDVIQPIIDHGDSTDCWIYVYGLTKSIVVMLGLHHVEPDHEIVFGYAPPGIDGQPDMSRAVEGTDVPETLKTDQPGMAAMAEMMFAAINHDDERSVEIWKEAIEGCYAVELVHVAARYAGDVRRHVVAESN